MRIILSAERDKYAVTDVIDLLADQTAAHAAEADRYKVIAELGLTTSEEGGLEVDVDSPKQVESRIKIRRLIEERNWSRRVSIGIQAGVLIAHGIGGHPCRPVDQVLDLDVTRDDLAAWLRMEKYVVEFTSSDSAGSRATEVPQGAGIEPGRSWAPRRPRRCDALTGLVEAALWAAYNAGHLDSPNARWVMTWINEHKPSGFTQPLDGRPKKDHIYYIDNAGGTKSADLDVIRHRIKRGIEKPVSEESTFSADEDQIIGR